MFGFVAWTGITLGMILGFLLCSVLSAGKERNKQVTCKDCSRRDTAECPFSHFDRDPVTNDVIGCKSDTEDAFYCGKARDGK